MKPVIVFTGRLSIPREQAQKLAVASGMSVLSKVERYVTHVVLGEQTVGKYDGGNKSIKQRRAEELGLSIIRERDFLAMCDGRDLAAEQQAAVVAQAQQARRRIIARAIIIDEAVSP